MATYRDIYGDVLTSDQTDTLSAVGVTHLDCVDEHDLELLQALMPTGAAWTREASATQTLLLRALGYEFSRVRHRAVQLIDETDPRTLKEMLPEVEAELGIIPDEGASLAARRSSVHSKELGYGDPTISYYTAVCVALGYTDTVYTEFPLSSLFTCTSACNDALYSRQWIFTVEIEATSLGAEADAALAAAFDEFGLAHAVYILTLT